MRFRMCRECGTIVYEKDGNFICPNCGKAILPTYAPGWGN